MTKYEIYQLSVGINSLSEKGVRGISLGSYNNISEAMTLLGPKADEYLSTEIQIRKATDPDMDVKIGKHWASESKIDLKKIKKIRVPEDMDMDGIKYPIVLIKYFFEKN